MTTFGMTLKMDYQKYVESKSKCVDDNIITKWESQVINTFQNMNNIDLLMNTFNIPDMYKSKLEMRRYIIKCDKYDNDVINNSLMLHITLTV